MKNKPEWIIAHHTVTPHYLDVERTAESINPVHQKRGFPISSLGLYVGYHYLIDKNGKIKQCRDDLDIGAHCSENGLNFKSIGISLIGNFENDVLEGKQLEAFMNLMDKKRKQYNIPREKVSYHKNFKATACPGKDVIKKFESIVDSIYGRPDGLTEWEVQALNWAAKEGVIVNRDHAIEVIKNMQDNPLKFAAWIAEILRKFKK
jgi:hypothetical protein